MGSAARGVGWQVQVPWDLGAKSVLKWVRDPVEKGATVVYQDGWN